MGAIEWSSEQQRAITTKNKNLLVAAAAGSGKTAVLVERIIRRVISEECDVDRLLVVTFTNAAAAEMRERIEKALSKHIRETPNAYALERQLVLLSNASISTLHSFCQSIIRQNFASIRLDPKFRLANEQEIHLMKQDIVEDLLETKYREGDEAFLAFADKYGTDRGDEPLCRMILKLFGFAQSQPFPLAWIDALPEAFRLAEEASLTDTRWMAVVRQEIGMVLAAAQEDNEQLIEQAENLCCAFYLPTLEADREVLQNLREIFARGNWEEMRKALYGVKFAVMRAPKGTEEEVKEFFKAPRERMKNRLKNLQKKYFQESEEELLEDLRAVAPSVGTICALAKDFAKAFAEEKQEKNIVDFNDLEHFALQILCAEDSRAEDLRPSAVALALQEKYVEVMVDEYQDINGVQEAILSLVTRRDAANLFAVGDVKQSIYRFRLADPSLFLKKYREYPMLGEAYERIDLAQNFRSRPSVLSAVNFLFTQLMVPESMELAYDHAAALHPGMDYPAEADGKTLEGPVELNLIDQKKGDEDEPDGSPASMDGEETEEELKGFAIEAQFIADRLRALKESKILVFDKEEKGYRAIRWRDMVVLLRSLSGKADVLLETLLSNNVPAYASLDSGYFAATEIRTVLSLLSLIDNARQDIPLAAVLHSPMGNFSAAELAELRLASPQGDFFAALLQANAPETKLADAIRAKAAAFLRKLGAWRSLARRVSVPELIWQIYRDTGYYDYVGGLPGGLLRQANLRMLCDRAADYEKTNFRGLFRFLRFVEKMQARETDLAVNRTLSESEDVVRIMSVHKSKGLEFPVVIVADLGKRFNLMDTKDDLLVHRELGLGPYRTEMEKSLRYPTFAREAIATKIAQESKAEEMRVLYVALTRAREKLILVGSAKDLAKNAMAWCRYIGRSDAALPAHAVLEAKTYLDWICLAVARHLEGKLLRDLAQTAETYAVPHLDDASHWDIRRIPAEQIQAGQAARNDADDLLSAVQNGEPLPPSEAKDVVEELLNWQYGHHGLGDVPAKLSVTELKRRFMLEEDDDAVPLWQIPELQPQKADAPASLEDVFRRPEFVREGTHITSTEYGTMMHSVMQHIDIMGDISLAGLKRQVQKMVDDEILLPRQASAIPLPGIHSFFASSLGQRMKHARRIWRELPFSRMLRAKRFYPEVEDEHEEIFIQGVIDALFEDEQGLVLLDYKTDRDTGPDRARKRYQLQIALYTEAMEAILGQPVRERYLYMLHDGSIVGM